MVGVGGRTLGVALRPRRAGYSEPPPQGGCYGTRRPGAASGLRLHFKPGSRDSPQEAEACILWRERYPESLLENKYNL